MTDNPVAAERGNERVDRVGTNVGDNDGRTLFVQAADGGLTDPRRAAGDDRDLARETPAYRAV